MRFDEFLLAFGSTSISFDPHCSVLAASDGMLILHFHVDDGRLTYTTRTACDRYRQAWAKEFDEELGPLGYSAAGVALEVGADVPGIAPGDRIAVAGGGSVSIRHGAEV